MPSATRQTLRSTLRASVTDRLMVALAAAGCLWLAVGWALGWI